MIFYGVSSICLVIPAKAGIQRGFCLQIILQHCEILDSGFRRNDGIEAVKGLTR